MWPVPACQPLRRDTKLVERDQSGIRQLAPNNAAAQKAASGGCHWLGQFDESSDAAGTPYNVHILEERRIRVPANAIKHRTADEKSLIPVSEEIVIDPAHGAAPGQEQMPGIENEPETARADAGRCERLFDQGSRSGWRRGISVQKEQDVAGGCAGPKLKLTASSAWALHDDSACCARDLLSVVRRKTVGNDDFFKAGTAEDLDERADTIGFV